MFSVYLVGADQEESEGDDVGSEHAGKNEDSVVLEQHHNVGYHPSLRKSVKDISQAVLGLLFHELQRQVHSHQHNYSYECRNHCEQNALFYEKPKRR